MKSYSIFRTLLSALTLSGALFTASAADPAVKITDVKADRTAGEFLLDYTVDLSSLRLKSEQQAAVTPVLLDAEHRVTLPGVIIDGRNRFIRDTRDGFEPEGYTLLRSGHGPSTITYSERLPLEDWMLDAELYLTDTITGCNCRPVSTGSYSVARFDMRPRVFTPEFIYITPVAEIEKSRKADGHAYIDFPVNKTEIYPDYRRNPIELANIRDTISLIKNDPDYTITSLSLKGYASPEGAYANNERLAKGRTEALRAYITKLYNFPASILHTSWEAEDWQGLADWLRKSTMTDADKIIEIINDPRYASNPDAREWLIKSRYPVQYKKLLAEVYPGLRHTDYSVSYTVRTYTTIEEIAAVYASDPRKLSLSELYKLALSFEAGSQQYNDIFETAARLYPDSPEAALNAAIPALQAGDLARAERFLLRAGDSPEAIYTRGVLLALKGDQPAGLILIRKAADAGLAPAAPVAKQLEEIIAHNK